MESLNNYNFANTATQSHPLDWVNDALYSAYHYIEATIEKDSSGLI